LVAASPRAWRPFLGPVAFLLAATIAIGVLRVTSHHHGAPAPVTTHHAAKAPAPAKKTKKVFYTVHAGDTLSAIAVKTHVSLAALRRLNPTVVPTGLFLGEKLRLR
jgi:LysM repeat protein